MTQLLRAGSPQYFANCMVIPVERTQRYRRITRWGYSFNFIKEAVAVVVKDDHGVRAIGIDGQVMSINALIDDVPALAAMLGR